MFYAVKEDWIYILEENFESIKAELFMFLSSNSSDLSAQYPDYKASGEWQTIPLIFFTIKHPVFYKAFPTTKKVLEMIPELIGAEFSILYPNTIISPHIGYSKEVMRTHLGLEVPIGDLGLKCGNESIGWEEGGVFSFNDGYLHEAWNETEARRIVLMVDTPVPESKYTAKEISSYKLNNLIDNNLLKIAPKEQWLKWLSDEF